MAKKINNEVRNRMEIQRLTRLVNNQKEIIEAKERSMKLHIDELDAIRAENNSMRRKLSNSQGNKRRLKNFVRELSMRISLLTPENDKDQLFANEGLTEDFYLTLCKTVKYNRNVNNN